MTVVREVLLLMPLAAAVAVQRKLAKITAATQQATAAQEPMFQPLSVAQPCITAQVVAAVLLAQRVAQQATAQVATAAHQPHKALTQHQPITVVAAAAAQQRKVAQVRMEWCMSDSAKNYCALVVNGSVTEIIVADYAWATANLQGDWYDLGGEPLTVAIGWTYDAELDKFVPPVFSEVAE
jgi:hypothetical protein